MRLPGPVAALLTAGLLAACNGGGGESDTDSDSATTTMTSTATTTTTGETDTATETGTTATTTGGTETGTGTTGGVGSCSPDAPVDLQVEGDIKADTTWQGTVRVTGDVDVYEGATLTILPGTAIVFDVDADLELGWNSQAATLVARGTAEAPIELCGASPQAGGWVGVIIQQNVTTDSALEHVLIRHAGGGGQPALTLAAPITVQDLTITDVAGVGVEAVDFGSGSAGLTVTGAGAAPAVLTGAGAITRFPLGGDLTGNADDVVEVDFGNLTVDTTVHDPGIPYRLEQDLDVYEDAELVFEAGVDWRFAVDTDLEIGWNSQAATLFVDGTAEAPVIFAGETADPGYWVGLIIQGNVTSNSRLSHAIFRDGGGGQPVLSVRAPITLEHLAFEANELGVHVAAQGLADGSTDLTITGTMGPPLTVEADAITSVPTGGAYTGNADDVIFVEDGNVVTSGTIARVGVPYLIDGAIDVYDGAALTIEPGVEFVMAADADIEVGWNSQEATFIAAGTADAKIVFRGRDPVAGWWRGLKINKNVLSSSKLEHVEILHAGQAGTGNLELRRPLTVTSSHFATSAGYGIRKEMADATDYNSGNTFADCDLGDVGNF